MYKISKDQLSELNLKKRKPKGSNKVLNSLLSLQIDESLFVSMDEIKETNIHYLYVAMKRKGKNLQQHKLSNGSYVFMRTV